MSQTNSSAAFRQRNASRGMVDILPWLVALVGVLAPQILVVVVTLTSTDSMQQTQNIVIGFERLVLALLLTVIGCGLYLLGAREALRISAASPSGAGAARA